MGVLNLILKNNPVSEAHTFELAMEKSLSADRIVLNRYSVVLGTTSASCVRVAVSFIAGSNNVLNAVGQNNIGDNLIALPLEASGSSKDLNLPFEPSNNVVPSRFQVRVYNEFGQPLAIKELILVFSHNGRAF